VTSNVDEMMDSFRDEITHGTCIFRLEERLHQFHGSGAWWVSLDANNATRVESTSLIRYISEVHGARAIDETKMIKPIFDDNFVEFLRREGVTDKTPDTWADLWAPQLMLVCLENAGLLNAVGQPEVKAESAECFTISSLLALPIFVQPQDYHILFCVDTCKNYIGAADMKLRPKVYQEGKMERVVLPPQKALTEAKKPAKKIEKKFPKEKIMHGELQLITLQTKQAKRNESVGEAFKV